MKKMMTLMLNRQSTMSWIETLPIIQLAYNNTPHTSTGFSPNEMTFGHNLNQSLDTSPTAIASTDELIASIDGIIEAAREHILKAQEAQAKFYNVSRRRLTFQKGDQVLLSIDGLTIPTSPKYTHRFLGPFTIRDVLDHDNYKLDLPHHMRIFPTFHISKLHLYKAPSPGSLQDSLHRPPPIDIEGEEGQSPYYDIDRILKHRFRKIRGNPVAVKEYYCKWTGYDTTEATWEPACTVSVDAPKLVETYEMNVSTTSSKPSAKITKKRKIT